MRVEPESGLNKPADRPVLGGHTVLRALADLGVDMVFGIPGIHALAIYDGFNFIKEVRNINVRHEQAATFMADAYFRVTRRPGVALVTGGPGATNCMVGLLEAYHSSSRVLVIMSQIHSKFVNRMMGALHETKDQLGMLSHVTGWNKLVTSPQEIVPAIVEGWERMHTGRPRPVQVEICTDALAAPSSYPGLGRVTLPENLGVSLPPREKLRQAARLLLEAARPCILSGGGAKTSGAGRHIQRLAERLRSPIVTTTMGKGIVDDDHPLHLGALHNHLAPREAAESADVILAVGTRLAETSTYRYELKIKQARMIQVDIDANNIGAHYFAHLPLVGDARAVLEGIESCLEGEPTSLPERPADLRSKRLAWEKKLRSKNFLAMQYVDALRQALPRDTIICCDETFITYWSARFLPSYEKGEFLYPDGSATLGFGLPAAIAAKLARPDRPVVALVGDGGFLFSVQELATMQAYNVRFPMVLVNDHCYGVLKFLQTWQFQGRRAETDLVNPDFLMLARSFGLEAEFAARPEDLHDRLKKALAEDRGPLIETRADFEQPFLLDLSD